MNDLYEYARKKTKTKCSQSPVMKTQIEGKILIAKNPLKVKEKEYELKKSKLLEEFVTQLHPRILSESLAILKKNYQNPSSLEQGDVTICNFLESLLKGEFLVDSYSEAVQHLKGICINSSPIQNGNRGGILKYDVPNIGNAGINEFSRKADIPKIFSSYSTGMEFVLIPAGKFTMGSPLEEEGRYNDEDPVHEVTIKDSFYMGKYPVTQKQWNEIMGSNPSDFKGDDRPVEKVSWDDALVFIKKLNEKEKNNKYRLPSEAEWEYACRAGTTTRYSFGDDESKIGDYAWYVNLKDGTHTVGQKKPNPWGLYDMHGNVWEWVQDKWHENYNGAPSDGSAWEDGDSSDRVIRGGGWSDNARSCRSANRGRRDPGDLNNYVGFRLLRKL